MNFQSFDTDGLNTTPQSQLEFFKQTFAGSELLTQDFESINVTHCNNLSSLVPKALFDENNLKEYLQNNIKVLENDFIAFDTLSSSEIVNVYVPFVNINNYLFDRFGSFEFKHSSTVLLEKLIGKFKNSNETQFFVNVESDFFQIIIIKNKQLVFHNAFNFKTKEDFIYYILFTSEQMQLNPEEFQLTFLGEIEEESELFKITYSYVRNIKFFDFDMKPTHKFRNSNHSNTVLFNQY